MREIYGKWSVQECIDDRYTHMLNAVTLVWGSLRLAPMNVLVTTLILLLWEFNGGKILARGYPNLSD